MNKFLIFVVHLGIMFTLSGCFMSAEVQNLDDLGSARLNQQKVFFDQTQLDVTEGSAAYVSIQLTEHFTTDTEVLLNLEGNSAAINAIPKSIVIPAGKLSAPLVIQTIEDSQYNGPQSLKIVLSSLNTSLVAEPNFLNIRIADNDLATATFSVSTQSVSESVGVVTLITQLDAIAGSTVTIPLIVTGTATEGASDDFTLSAPVITIAEGQSTSVLSITINNDSIYEAVETLVLNMGTPTNAKLGAVTTYTLDITNDDLGAFAISGITGPGDVTLDAFLNSGTEPTINWGSSTGATSFDVTVLANDGTTVVCPTQNTTSTNYSFTGCALSLGNTYKVNVVAKSSALSLPASNALYSFYVNQAPVAGNDGPIRIMKGSAAISYSVLTNNPSQGLVLDSDPDVGDTISITAVSQGTAGGIVTNPNGTTVSFAPATASFTGVDTFTYTIADSRGASAVATVTVHVMSTYTWTGKVSSAWANNGNWCGTIANNECLGTTGFPNSTAIATHVAVFDGSCTSTGHSCNVNISSATAAYGININSSYSGTISQTAGAGNTLSIGAAGYIQRSGSFTGGNATVTITGGTFTQTGGSSDWGTSILYLNMTQGANTTAMSIGASASMSFQAGGTFRLSGKGACGSVAYTLDVNSSQTFQNVIFDGNNAGCGASKYLLGGGDIMTVNGTFTQNPGIVMAGNTYKLYGNLVLSAPAADGGIIEMLGSTSTTYSYTGGGSTGKLIINKPPGFSVSPAGGTTSFGIAGLEVVSGEFNFPTGTLTIANGFAMLNLIKIYSGTIVNIPTNSTTNIGLSGACGSLHYLVDVDSTITFENLNLYGQTTGCNLGYLSFGSGDIINVAKTLNVNSTGGVYGLSSDIYVQGNVMSSGTLAYSSPSRIILNGTGTQNITQNAGGHFPSITINKSPGVETNLLTSINVSREDADFFLQSGTLNLNGFALIVSDGSSNNNILTFSSGTIVNRGGTGTFTGEQMFTAGAIINP